jgi:hypothetical protein
LAFIMPLKAKADDNSGAVVVTEGAMVYNKADFDSQVIGYYQAGQKVTVSKKRFGPFYRVKFKQGVWGYISDVDIKTGDSASLPKDSGSRKDDAADLPGSSSSKHIFNSFYLGIAGASVQYRELLARQEYSDSLIFYGIRATLPVSFLSGLFLMDLTALTTSTVPNYYKQVSSIAPSGMAALVDLQLQYGLMNFSRRKGWLYIGAGPLFGYTRYLVEIRGSKSDLEEAKAGMSFSVGASYSLGRFALKFEPRYYLERTQYLGFLGSLQYAF